MGRKPSNQVMGQVGAIGMGVAVGAINAEHGWEKILEAGGKQWGYSTVAALFLVHVQEKLYDVLEGRRVPMSDAVSVLTPSVLTTLLTYLMHHGTGTAEDVNSTLFTGAVSLTGFTWLHMKRKAKILREQMVAILNED